MTDEVEETAVTPNPFAVEREIEDIEALIDDVGGSACLYGISSGACLALEAAMKLGDKVKKLAIYEAPYNSDETDQKFGENIPNSLRSFWRQIAEVMQWRFLWHLSVHLRIKLKACVKRLCGQCLRR